MNVSPWTVLAFCLVVYSLHLLKRRHQRTQYLNEEVTPVAFCLFVIGSIIFIVRFTLFFQS